MKQKKIQKIHNLVTGAREPVRMFTTLSGKKYPVMDVFSKKIRFADMDIIPGTMENKSAIMFSMREGYLTPEQASEAIKADYICFGFLATMQAVQYDNKKLYHHEKIGQN